MNRLRAVAFAWVTALAAGCPTPPPDGPSPSRSEISVDRPTGAVANGVDQVQVRVTVKDGTGNPVPGVAVQLSATGTGNSLVQPAPTDAAGVATGTLATTVAEAKTFSATIPQGALTAQATAVFGPGPASAGSSTVVAAPGPVIANGTASATITVTLRDATGNPVSGQAVSLSASGSGNTLTQPAPTDASGVTVGVIRSTRAEAKTVTATAGGSALLQQPTVEFVHGAPARLAFAVPPSSAAAGAIISPAVQVVLQDASGNQVHGASGQVTVALAGGTAGAVLGGARSAVAVDGVAVFTDLSVDRSGAGYTLVASGVSLATATSPAFDVTSGPASRLAFMASPSSAAAGALLPPVQVALQDAAGNVIITGTDSVTLALAGPSGTLSGPTTVAAVAGVATFTNLSIDRAGAGYALVATASSFSGATSAPFIITPAAPSRLVFSAQPPDAAAGVAISPAIQVSVQDAFGNTVTSDTRAVALALGNNPGGATLGGATPVNAVGGVATFSALTMDRVGAGYTLVATASGLAGAVSAPFNVSAGPAARLVFITQPPATVPGGLIISPSVQVAVQDAAGNVVSSASNAVTLSLTGGTAGAVLSGALTQAAAGGIATFSVSVDRVGTGYALVATGAALTSSTSSSFNVVPAPAARLAFTVPPSNSIAGQGINPPVTVAVQDAAGNTVPTSTASITLSLGGGGPGAILTGTLTRSAVAGVATFPGLSVNRADTGYFLNAITPSLPAAASSTFAVSPGLATRLAFTAQPAGTATAGQFLPVTVAVQDSSGNTVPSPAQTVSLALASGPVVPLGGTTTLTTTAGVAQFTDVHIDAAAVGYSLRATAGALSGITSIFTIAPDAANQLAFIQQPSNVVAGAAITPPVTVIVRDRFGNTVTSTVQPVSMSIESGPPGGVLNGTTTVVPVSGFASFANLSLPIPGSYRLAASAGSLTGATSNTFNSTGFPPVTGTQVIHHVTDTGLVDRPADLSGVAIGAYMAPGDGGTFTFFPGSGTDAGTFQVLSVPTDGGYYLRFGNDYIAGGARTWDLGFHQQGRPDAARADAGTRQRLVLSGMDPWTLDAFWRLQDDLQMYSSNANAWFGGLQRYDAEGDFLSGGETVFDQTMDYALIGQAGFLPNLANASSGDLTYFSQLTLRDAGFVTDDAGTALAWNTYDALARAMGPMPVTVADGQLSSASGTFSPVPQTGAFPVSWQIAEGTPLSFGSFRTGIHPNAWADFFTHQLSVSALPSAAFGLYGGGPELVAMAIHDGTGSPQADQQLTFAYGDPFPGSWARVGQASTTFFVPYLVPRSDGGTPVATEETASLAVADLLPSFPSGALRPQVSPAIAAQIAGAPFFADQTLTSTTPLVSWSSPAVGPATYYVLRIRRLSVAPSGTVTRTDVARVYTTGTSVRIPPGILQTRGTYSIRLTAVQQPGFIDTVPFEQRWPAHSASRLSGLLTVP